MNLGMVQWILSFRSKCSKSNQYSKTTETQYSAKRLISSFEKHMAYEMGAINVGLELISLLISTTRWFTYVGTCRAETLSCNFHLFLIICTNTYRKVSDQFFGRKYFKIITSVPDPETIVLGELYDRLTERRKWERDHPRIWLATWKVC
jgi:hypothetical protein